MLAELGGVGLGLLLTLVAWLVWRLGRWSFVVAALMLQPMIDYVLNFPVVLAADALVLGAVAVLAVQEATPAARPRVIGRVRP